MAAPAALHPHGPGGSRAVVAISTALALHDPLYPLLQPHRLCAQPALGGQLPEEMGQQGTGATVDQLLFRVLGLGSTALAPEHMQQRHLLRFGRPEKADGAAEIGEIPAGEGGPGVGVDPLLEAPAIELGRSGRPVGMPIGGQSRRQGVEPLQGLHGVVPVLLRHRRRLPFRESLEEAGKGAALLAEVQHGLPVVGGGEALQAGPIQQGEHAGLGRPHPLAAEVHPGPAPRPLQPGPPEPATGPRRRLQHPHAQARALQGAGCREAGQAGSHHHHIDGLLHGKPRWIGSLGCRSLRGRGLSGCGGHGCQKE